MRRASNLLLCAMQSVKDLALLSRQSDEDFGAFAAHAHQTDRGLWVALRDALEQDIGGIDL